jgi:hypothetical protein
VVGRPFQCPARDRATRPNIKELLFAELLRRYGFREVSGLGGRRPNDCASSLHPTLRKSAKDGAPELLRLVDSPSYWKSRKQLSNALIDLTII